MNSSDNPIPNEPRATEVDELCSLVASACDNVLTEAQRVRLNELLRQGIELRTVYLRYIALHSSLTTTAGGQAVQGVELFRNRLAILAKETGSRLPPARIPFSSASLLSWAALVGFALLPAAIYCLGFWETQRDNPAVELVERNHPEQLANRAVPQTAQVARVQRVSANVVWLDPNESFTVQSSIRTGSKLRLVQGEIELVYETGVKLLLIGPADFVSQEWGGELRRGGLMASVPVAGQGFTIETPNGKVVDLGTQFGVVVDDFGVSEVSVFAGKVEAFPTQPTGANQRKFELLQGRALQWSNEMLKPLEADPRRLPFSLASFSQTGSDKLPGETLLQSGLRRDLVDFNQWKFLGDIVTTATGFVLEGQRGQARQPYLVSSREFNPTNGPVTVVCDIRFPQLAPHDQPSFAILTRSADERTAMERPWKNTLATCVRCNFRTAKDTFDGLLETATKYERDRELTGISWRGFRRPEAGTAYRLVMRDDGVNVSFTVSQVDNPAVSKTVTCRSLFRGYQNHIALEGWDEGVTIVDHVQVFQAAPVENLASDFYRLPVAEGSHASATSSKQANNLIDLVPSSAALAVKDHFDQEEVDPALWATLGDVVLDAGAISLGFPSKSGHIDTFHPRPYLLTRRQFTPADGKLYVLGRIEFDENFLQGYGGSFAVLTRCDDQYGVGPEWAVSALRTGVRSNFWPAAPHQNHILEIHEKATPNSLAFLAGTGLEINPESRSYFFCLEDDGQRTALTLQDATDRSIRQTVQNAKGSPALLRSGFIGFESCWGSRVLLDDIEIYVQPRSDELPEAK